MISACASLCPSTSSLRSLPFVPPPETHPSLISHPTPLSSPLLIRSLRSAPRPSRPFRPSFFPSSPVALLVCPSLVCVSLSLLPTFPLFLLGGLGFYPCLAPSLSSSGSLFCRFLSFFLPLVGQFHPLSIRAAHCSRVSRIAEVKPSDDFLAGTWFRALLFFLSISPSLSLVGSHRRSRCYC